LRGNEERRWRDIRKIREGKSHLRGPMLVEILRKKGEASPG